MLLTGITLPSIDSNQLGYLNKFNSYLIIIKLKALGKIILKLSSFRILQTNGFSIKSELYSKKINSLKMNKMDDEKYFLNNYFFNNNITKYF